MSEVHIPNIAILASGDRESGGGGSTMEYFIRATKLGLVAAEVGLVVCNNPREKVGVYNKVDGLNKEFGSYIPVQKINSVDYPPEEKETWKPGEQTLAESEAICKLIDQENFDLVLLLGYMKRIKGDLLTKYGLQPSHDSIFQARMLNSHPGPLPETEGEFGIHVQEKVLELGLSHSAHTIHAVTSEYDTGDVYRKTPVLVKPGQNAQELFDEVQVVEKSVLLTAVPEFLEQQREFRLAS